MSDEADNPQFQFRYEPPNQYATLELLPASGASGTLKFTLEELDRHIGFLAHARARMSNGATKPIADREQIQAILDPKWFIQPEYLRDGTLLVLDHPGFGRLAFCIPHHEAAHMGRLLVQNSEIPKLEGGTPN